MAMLAVVATVQLEIKVGDGMFFEEENNAILYENTMPIMYEMIWKEDEETMKLDSPTKWSTCYENATCMLAKTLSDYKQAIDSQISKLEPNIGQASKEKRFSIIKWILKACCGVATEDDFETLYRDEERVEVHVDDMRKALHSDHRSIQNIITSADTLSKDFSGLMSNAKHEVTDVMMDMAKLSQKEDMIVANTLSIYKQINRLTKKIRKNLATTSCQNKKIPATMVTPEMLMKDLIKIEEGANKEGWELAIPTRNIGKYYGIAIAACVITIERLVVRIKVPVQEKNRKWKLYEVIPLPIGDKNTTCEKQPQSTRIIVKGREEMFGWVLNEKHCKPEINQMCRVPRNTRWETIKNINIKTPTNCENTTEMIITHLSEESYAIAHPVTKLEVMCKELIPLNIPNNIHGYVQIKLPCKCKLLRGEETLIANQFPCDENWEKNITMSHIIPEEWADHVDPESVLNNSMLTYDEKLRKLMKEDWNITFKFNKKKEEDEEIYEEPMTYHKIRNKIEDIHVEWTTILTALVLLVLFRKPINILLIRMVSTGRNKNHISQMQVTRE